MELDFSKFSPNQRYHLMTQAIIPRPIAWVMTENKTGKYNLAPFSYFSAVSSDPALIMISVGKKPEGPFEGELKDTRVNLEQVKYCTVHIAHAGQAELVTKTAATLANEDSELELIDHELVNIHDHPIPGIANAPITLACELFEIQEIGNTPQSLIFLKVNKMLVEDDVIQEDSKGRLAIDALKVNPLSRLGGGQYADLKSVFSIQRPK